MTSERITEDELCDLLTKKYKCRKDGTGKTLASPYGYLDEMPTYYIAPSGLFFAVPPPPNGTNYSIADVRDILEISGIEVVVKMSVTTSTKSQT